MDDFDDSYPLPYTNDLVRLASSVKIVKDLGHLTTGLKNSCDIILQAYSAALRSGGHPLVLAEHEGTLEKLGINAIEPPEHFWAKLNAHPGVRNSFPNDAKLALEQTLPQKNLDYKVVLRRAGMGSLGQQRFVLSRSGTVDVSRGRRRRWFRLQ